MPDFITDPRTASAEYLAEQEQKAEAAGERRLAALWRAQRLGRRLLSLTCGREGALHLGYEERIYAEFVEAQAVANDTSDEGGAGRSGLIYRRLRQQAAGEPPPASAPIKQVRGFIKIAAHLF